MRSDSNRGVQKFPLSAQGLAYKIQIPALPVSNAGICIFNADTFNQLLAINIQATFAWCQQFIGDSPALGRRAGGLTMATTKPAAQLHYQATIPLETARSPNIDAQLGFKWAEAENPGIDSSDTFNLLVFVSDKKVVHFFALPRTADFKGMETCNLFTPENDEFEVKSVNAGTSKRLNFL